MSKDKLSKDYQDGYESFLKHALENITDPKKIYCPCKKDSNIQKLDAFEFKGHLYFNGTDYTYQIWIWHGEEIEVSEFLTRF